MNDATHTIHKFEAAGLGKAPFQLVGFDRRIGPIKMLDRDGMPTGTEVGAPGQPMGSCDFCGMGIADCYIIQSADGKRFIVGSTCVNKTGDAGLRRAMAPHKRRLKQERDDARISAAVETFERPAVRALLASLPHGNEYRASQGDTLADWADFIFVRGGRSGKIKAARVIESAAKHLVATGKDS